MSLSIFLSALGHKTAEGVSFPDMRAVIDQLCVAVTMDDMVHKYHVIVIYAVTTAC